MTSRSDEDVLTGLYTQRQELLKHLADVDTNIKLLETQMQDKSEVSNKIATDELAAGGNTEVDKVKQLIYRCMQDASGLKDVLKVTEACRHIQETLNPSEAANRPRLHFRNVFVHEAIARARELSVDPNGSDFMQHIISLMKSGTTPAKLHELNYDVKPRVSLFDEPPKTSLSELLLVIEQLGNSLVIVTCNTSGARVSQKLIDCIATLEEFDLLANTISPSIIELAKDINGNHSLSKLIASGKLRTLAEEATGDDAGIVAERVATIHRLIFAPITENCIDICKNRQGCCIIQKCLQSAPEPYYTAIVNTVLSNALKLVQDPFGNYVVQFILDRHQDLGANRGKSAGAPASAANYTNQIIRQMLHHVAELSCDKFSSNVVEKCLKTASPDVRQLLVDELTDPQVLPKLLTDSFANYVIQTAIVTASDDGQFMQLRDSIMPLQNLLKNSPYGVKIEAKLSRRHRETARKQTKKKEAAVAAAAAAAANTAMPAPQSMPPTASPDGFLASQSPMLSGGLPQTMPPFVPSDGAVGAPVTFANLPPDLLFSQQQMLSTMPFMLQGNQQFLGLPNTQPQFVNMNMPMNLENQTSTQASSNYAGHKYR